MNFSTSHQNHDGRRYTFTDVILQEIKSGVEIIPRIGSVGCLTCHPLCNSGVTWMASAFKFSFLSTFPNKYSVSEFFLFTTAILITWINYLYYFNYSQGLQSIRLQLSFWKFQNYQKDKSHPCFNSSSTIADTYKTNPKRILYSNWARVCTTLPVTVWLVPSTWIQPNHIYCKWNWNKINKCLRAMLCTQLLTKCSLSMLRLYTSYCMFSKLFL